MYIQWGTKPKHNNNPHDTDKKNATMLILKATQWFHKLAVSSIVMSLLMIYKCCTAAQICAPVTYKWQDTWVSWFSKVRIGSVFLIMRCARFRIHHTHMSLSENKKIYFTHACITKLSSRYIKSQQNAVKDFASGILRFAISVRALCTFNKGPSLSSPKSRYPTKARSH